VQAAVHGQDVLGGEPARSAVFAPADGEPVVGGLDLQRCELREEPCAEVGTHMMGQQRSVPRDGSRPKRRLGVGEPAVEVLVDGEPDRVQRDAAAALQLRGDGRLGLGAGGVAAQGLEPAGAVGAAG
jgi:hypothetical protein